MEKINTETFINNYIKEETSNLSKEDEYSMRIGLKAGLEYAESHYLAKLEEKDKKIQEYENDVQENYVLLERKRNTINTAWTKINTLEKELQQAKELLKRSGYYIPSIRPSGEKLSKEIEEFLKK